METENMFFESDKNHRILIVDDNPQNLQVLGGLLQENNYVIEFAISGKSALEWIEFQSFDLILLDINMPEMDGFEVCKQIRSQPRLDKMPVIFLSAYSDRESILKGFEFGAQDFVTKPFDSRELLARVKTHLTLKESLEKLENANKHLESFSYSISHDLKAPLRHILAFMALFLENKSTEFTKEEQSYLDKITDSATQMEKLIDAILSFSRVNQAEMRKIRIQSSAMVQKVIKFFEPELQNRTITFHVAPLPDMLGDEELIRQVWVNLISNAIKYTGRKPEAIIEIGASVANKEITFFVKDNGAGFNMKYAEKLFGVFKRLHKASDFDGIGIGLANVNRIITRHNGYCRAEGIPDMGATFYFSVPG